MFEKIVYVVGDNYAEFGKNDGVITFSDFMEHITQNNICEPSVLYVPGQGICKTQSEKVLSNIRTTKSNLTFLPSHEEPVHNELVHKHKLQNVLISTPVKIGENQFSASLLARDDYLESTDHLTGQHIQGMLLMEAARQLLIAIPTIYYLEQEKRSRYKFLFNKLIIEYHSFVFPLPVQISTSVDRVVENRGRNIEFEMRIDFFQCDQNVTTSKCYITVCDGKLISKLESQKAKCAIDASQKDQYVLMQKQERWNAEALEI